MVPSLLTRLGTWKHRGEGGETKAGGERSNLKGAIETLLSLTPSRGMVGSLGRD